MSRMGEEDVWGARGQKSKMRKKKYSLLRRLLFPSLQPQFLLHLLQSWQMKGFCSAKNHTPSPCPSLLGILKVQTFYLTEVHWLNFSSPPSLPCPAPQGQVASERREAVRSNQCYLLCGWFHQSNYERHTNQKSQDPCLLRPFFQVGGPDSQ